MVTPHSKLSAVKAKAKAHVTKAPTKNRWILFVKAFAEKHNLSYRDALKHPHLKDCYVPAHCDQNC